MRTDIEIWQDEIKQLEADKANVKNSVSQDALQYQILVRKASINNAGN